MKKILKGVICTGLCVAMLGTAAGCNKSTSGLDSETRALQLSTGALDGNFNPFYYTSANDGSILSLTQISMLTTDNNGDLVVGNNEDCVVLNYSQTVAADSSTTEYKFVIKNGIKFSDGVDLTIKDVLFSLYVYLDPAYTGSATIYSTDIQGLKAYRAQDATFTDDNDTDIDARFTATAKAKIEALKEWSEDSNRTPESSLSQTMKSDLATVRKLFEEEANSDWTSVSQSWQTTYEHSHRFTSAWEAYLYNEGLVTVQTIKNDNGSTTEAFEDLNHDKIRDDDELYYTTLDMPVNDATATEPEAQAIIEGIAAATTADKIAAYKAENDCDDAYAKEQLEKEYCVALVIQNYTDPTNISNVLTYWATASNALEEFTGQARTEHYQEIKDSGRGVESISGITTEKVTSFTGVNGTETYGEQHDVLKIVINGVDPKAIYNFGFTVAPLHYYSGEYNGHNYATEETINGKTNYGVDVGNKDFFDTVVSSTDKNGLPVGAGPYQATSSSHGTADRTTFFKNNIVYFKRNDNFTTVGTGINNAKIKYIEYKVLSDDKILDALTTQIIDFGMPNATSDNRTTVASKSYLSYKDYKTGGYGYVGINPKYVPEYQVRQAIMKAMDTTQTIAFYGTQLANVIYRPMSTTSWAYPTNEDGSLVGEYSSIKYDTTGDEIKKLVEDAGYTLQNRNGKDIYVKTSDAKNGASNATRDTTLKLTFTIAGETKDHPAYKMFCDARDKLNALGFEVTVQTDIQALKKMNSGSLAVWAAAWSSAADPDPYQMYHKDSKATSVNNWNYSTILNNSTDWSYEYNKINQISSLIDAGRATLEKSERIDIYAECLDLIMDLAVELPTYQRRDLCVFNKNVIDGSTLVQNPSYAMGLFDKIWEIDYVK